jgi:hypothetical protein
MTEAAQRIARLEAFEQIRELTARHAQALDFRDLDALVALYVEDVQAPDGRAGRAALGEWFDHALRAYSVSFHLIGNHLIDVLGDDRARGTLYCRAEYQVADRWIVMPMQYEDHYEQHDGSWLLRQRTARAFYAADVLERPSALPGRFDFPGHPEIRAAELPEAWQSWQRFWNGGIA